MERLIRTDSSVRDRLAAAGYGGEPRDVVGAALLDYALASNDKGVILVSMLQERHLVANAARADRKPNASVVSLIDGLSDRLGKEAARSGFARTPRAVALAAHGPRPPHAPPRNSM